MAIKRKNRIFFVAMVLPILMPASIRAETDTQLLKELSKAPAETRQVGIAYAAWHDQIPWGKTGTFRNLANIYRLMRRSFVSMRHGFRMQM